MRNNDRTAKRAAKLISLQGIDRLFAIDVAEVVSCVEDSVADIFESAAMELVPATSGDDVYNTPAFWPYSAL
jgi:hypothetical protein